MANPMPEEICVFLTDPQGRGGQVLLDIIKDEALGEPGGQAPWIHRLSGICRLDPPDGLRFGLAKAATAVVTDYLSVLSPREVDAFLSFLLRSELPSDFRGLRSSLQDFVEARISNPTPLVRDIVQVLADGQLHAMDTDRSARWLCDALAISAGASEPSIPLDICLALVNPVSEEERAQVRSAILHHKDAEWMPDFVDTRQDGLQRLLRNDARQFISELRGMPSRPPGSERRDLKQVPPELTGERMKGAVLEPYQLVAA